MRDSGRLRAELDELNMLDVDAVSIPFSGPIDLSTLEPDTVFFADRKGRRVRLERLVWTAATNTLQTRCTDRRRAPEGVPA